MITNSKSYVQSQYGDSSNLDIRILLHEKYSTNTQDWHEWVFEQMSFKPGSTIIEFGCGTGSLWMKNKSKIQDDWSITLTDMSEGMLDKASQMIGEDQPISYRVVDIQAVDTELHSFDAAIANHMLYHVPNLDQALAEIQRILKPQGVLYTSTNGRNHFKEIFDWVREFDPTLPFSNPLNYVLFGLEDGEALLRRYFANVQLVRFPSHLRVTSADDLANYICSIGAELKPALERKGSYDAFIQLLESKKTEQGFIPITKDSGLFISRN